MTDQELVEAFPGARIDQDSRAWFTGLLRQELLVNRCDDCGRWSTPPTSICPSCWSTAVTPTPVSGRGVVYSRTGTLAVVELVEQDGLRLTASTVQELPIGTPVEVAWGGPYPGFREVAE